MANGFDPYGYRRGQPASETGFGMNPATGMAEYYKEREKEEPIFGKAPFMNDLIQQLINNPQYGQLYGLAMGAFDPRIRGQLANAEGLQQQMLQGGYFSPEEEQVYRDLISGETLRGQGGTLYDLIQEQFAPARDEARAYAASRGLTPGAGAAMGYEGEVMGGQQRAFAEQMVNKYLDMVGMGTQGLGQMGTEQLARQQSAANVGQWLSQFIEQAQQNRLGLGLNITQSQQAPLMNLLGMSYDEWARVKNKPSGAQQLLGGLTQVAPMFMDAMFPGAGSALGAGLFASNVMGDFSNSQNALAGWESPF